MTTIGVVPWRCDDCGSEVGGPVERPSLWWVRRADDNSEQPKWHTLCEFCWVGAKADWEPGTWRRPEELWRRFRRVNWVAVEEWYEFVSAVLEPEA